MLFGFLPFLMSALMSGLRYMACGVERVVAICLQFIFQLLLGPRKLTKPANHSLLSGAATDLVRSKHELVVENALLRQQLIVLRRQVKRPQLTSRDRALLVLLASRLQTWRNALFIVKPDTLLRWHRQGFRLFWREKVAG